jgi:hypothetical protein
VPADSGQMVTETGLRPARDALKDVVEDEDLSRYIL